MSCAALELREVAEVPYGMDAREESDDDRIEHLEDEIAVLAAHIHAATHRLLVLIAEFDRLGGWERFGYPDCAHWLSVRTGVDIHISSSRLRRVRKLCHSFSKMWLPVQCSSNSMNSLASAMPGTSPSVPKFFGRRITSFRLS